jgi:hypothetical protein
LVIEEELGTGLGAMLAQEEGLRAWGTQPFFVSIAEVQPR